MSAASSTAWVPARSSEEGVAGGTGPRRPTWTLSRRHWAAARGAVWGRQQGPLTVLLLEGCPPALQARLDPPASSSPCPGASWGVLHPQGLPSPGLARRPPALTL